jgi:triosephosphate isomerase (TIM)
MTARRPLIAGNWKMYKTGPEAADFVKTFKPLVAGVTGVDIMIAPPFTCLSLVALEIGAADIQLGAQNLHWQPEGAFTGEIAAGMLTAAGCRCVIIGHSERRQFFGETDETINLKIEAATRAGLAPVFCIGETEAQRDAGDTFSVLDKQVKNGLQGQLSEMLESLVVAYEPVWAIGTGKTATKEQAQEVHHYLRQRFSELFGGDFAQRLRILYGGSVKPSNIKDLMAMPDIDGALVGGASLDPDSFSQLVRYQS